jgi:hypothetical protein
MTSTWEGVFDSLILEPQFREYETAPKHVREKLASQLGLTLEQYDEKLHWGFSEFYD